MKIQISVIVPVYNAGKFLERNLAALLLAADEATEIILVNDSSTDNSLEIAERFPVKIFHTGERSGPARARNLGVSAAKGEWIIFVDADVIVPPHTIRHFRQVFAENPEISAAFGSYDDAPSEPNFMSQYKNLAHHFYHQIGNRETDQLWTGLACLKREAFLSVGGYDAAKYPQSSVEDIDLGYRMRERGHRILLIKELQAKHLKHWTFFSLVRTDIFQRAIPWTRLLLTNPHIKPDLNLQTSQKISALCVFLGLFSLPLIFWSVWFMLPASAFLLAVLYLNRQFYLLFLRKKGFWFTLRVVPLHLFYYIYSAAAFVFCRLQFFFKSLNVSSKP